MICHNPTCRTPMPEGAAFCPQCGTKVAPNVGVGRTQTISGLGTIVPESLIDRRTATVLEPGTVFAERYTVLRKLGLGGMGIVYLARDRNTGEDIALKLLHPDLVEGEEAMQRLVAEGVTARRIRHPNIVAVYDIGRIGSQPFLTMEYVAGGTLRSWLSRAIQAGQEVPVATAIGIVKAILAGLAEAHRMGVVHRDLKPENVLLAGDPFQGDFRLKLLDFGIAKAVLPAGVATPGNSASSIGTLLYMAPEQRTAAQAAGPAADLYSVTAMLFELLLESPPQGSFEPPSRMRGDVPPALDAIIEKGLKLRARDRFASANDYALALDRAMEVPRPVAQPPSATAPPVGRAPLPGATPEGPWPDAPIAAARKPAPPPSQGFAVPPRPTGFSLSSSFSPENYPIVRFYRWLQAQRSAPPVPGAPWRSGPAAPLPKKRKWLRVTLIVFGLIVLWGAIGQQYQRRLINDYRPAWTNSRIMP